MAYCPSKFLNTGLIKGSFVEVDGRQTFEFGTAADLADREGFGPEFPDVVFVGGMSDDEYRFAKVLKTRVKIVVDEDADGNAVVETWTIRNRRDYSVAA